jgi:SPP1 family phage portal protein
MASDFKIPCFDYKGIKRITIPKSDSDFSANNGYGWEVIKKYLPKVLATHKKNAEKISYLYDYFLGMQDILAKKRLHNVNRKNNNIEIENHAKRQVDFKVGFICGEARDYTHKSDSDSDDLVFLDRYFTDCNFFAKDAELTEWIYTVGIGVTQTKPRVDIIVSGGVDPVTGLNSYRYKAAADGYDIEYEAPFEFYCVDPRENFVVYSSAAGNAPLFSVSYADVDVSKPSDKDPIFRKRLLVETRYAWFEFDAESDFGVFYWARNEILQEGVKSIAYLPLLEYAVNKDRIGIVETNRSAFNTINLFRSSINDSVVENANALLVFKNVDIDAETVAEMREAGAVIISDSQTARQGGLADLRTVTVEIAFDKMTTYLDQVMQNSYDIVGVPMASGQVTSGGDTGQARLLGGGWNNAYVIAHKEIRERLRYDYEQLKLFLMLCKQVPNCPINELFASQIDINYRINQNDNLQVKAQSMKYLYDMHLPLEFILKVGGLSNDIKTDSREWQARIDAAAKAEETASLPAAQTDIVVTEEETPL